MDRRLEFDIFLKDVCRWLRAHAKMVIIVNQRNTNPNHHDTASHLSEWLSLKSLEITNVGEDVGKRGP